MRARHAVDNVEIVAWTREHTAGPDFRPRIEFTAERHYVNNPGQIEPRARLSRCNLVRRLVDTHRGLVQLRQLAFNALRAFRWRQTRLKNAAATGTLHLLA